MSNQPIRYRKAKDWGVRLFNPVTKRGFDDSRDGRPFADLTLSEVQELSAKVWRDGGLQLAWGQRQYEYGRYWAALGLGWPLTRQGELLSWAHAAVKRHHRDCLVSPVSSPNAIA